MNKKIYSEEQLKMLRNNFSDEQIDRISQLGAGAVPEEEEDILLLKKVKKIFSLGNDSLYDAYTNYGCLKEDCF